MHEGSTHSPGRRARLVWIGALAFASGLPFGIFKDFVPLWLRDSGVSVEHVGWMAGALAAPWSLKVLWAPLVDRFGHRRRFAAASLLAAALALVALAATGTAWLGLVSVLLVSFAVAGATQDIAVDSYTISILRPGEEGPANGVRVTFYRAALLVAGGVFVALAVPLTWSGALLVAAGTLGVMAIVALAAPRATPGDRSPTWRELAIGFGRWLALPGALPLAAFILFYKWPDAALGPTVRTFWLDSGLSKEAIGSLAIPNMVATVAGAWLGAIVVARFGIMRGLLWCGLAQALSNLAYAAAAMAGGGYTVIFAAAVVESGTGGLGTTAFLSLLMRVCEKERSASEFALVSALFAATRDVTGSISGYGVAFLGYAGWFAATTAFALPGLALLASKRLAARAAETPALESKR